VLTEAVDALKNGQLSSRELTLACVERAHSWQPEINALLAIEKERALASADAADSARARGETLGLLHGVPFAQKDMYDRAGQETSCGSKIRTDHIASLTATVLERLDAAGAVDLGRLNMSEFALGPTGLNAHFGRARNPWNVDIATGGSSSGSGAAIAAGLIYGALGSNTEGSIRLPAALCGVAGLKPTQGRVSRFGAIPLSTSQDCVGPLAPTVRDVALIYQAIAGPDPRDGACSNRQVAIPTLRDDLKGVRIGIPKRFYGEDVDPEFSAVITESRRRFDAWTRPWWTSTCQTNDISPNSPILSPSLRPRRFSTTGCAIAARTMTSRRAPDCCKVWRSRGVAYLRAQQLRVVMLEEFVTAAFPRCDALHVPVLPSLPPRFADVDLAASLAIPGVVAGMTRFTRPFSFLGLPALAQPIGFSAEGLPIAMQLVGRPFAESRLLEIGVAYEIATGFKRRLPAPSPAPAIVEGV
jgi:aspartyl-tRNA(Asn)/glutamyl-tRNA(Gln) amidotransferase subunit A